jgi:peptidoglycan/xylan/chitin deacetylase (PgdA/CDA1 family)
VTALPVDSRSWGTLVATLGYHDVTDLPTESGFQREGARAYRLSTRQFREHLAQIADGPLTPALVNELDLRQPGRHLLLTFDDGGKSALAIGDELCRRGWRGHFLVSTGLIGGRTFLSASEIRHLHASGHLLGSHSHSHPDIYRDLPWERMVVEWSRSADVLSQLLGDRCLIGSVPGGDTSDEVCRSAAAAGIRYLFTSEPRLRPRVVGGCWVLGRFCAKMSTTSEEIAQLTRFEGWASRRVIREIRNAATRTLPFLYRLYVERSTRHRQEILL